MNIRKITTEDTETIYEMMRVFYDSPALIHKSSDKVLRRDINDCLSEDCPFVEAFIFEEEKEAIGYAMASKNYTTEYGGICIWVEDLYFVPSARGRGYANEFFAFLEKTYPEAVRYKLEVEQENERAVKAYEKNGYSISGYLLMTKEMDRDE